MVGPCGRGPAASRGSRRSRNIRYTTGTAIPRRRHRHSLGRLAVTPFPVPEAMTTAEAQTAVEDFVAAARRAIEAGADGVEIHGANGYPLHQFLSPGANHRSDEYGGSPRNRVRFVVDVVTAVAKAVGAERVGLRISPEINISDTFETDRDDVLATYGTLADQLRPLGLAYLSVLHSEPGGELVQELRQRFNGKLIVNSGFLGGGVPLCPSSRRPCRGLG